MTIKNPIVTKKDHAAVITNVNFYYAHDRSLEEGITFFIGKNDSWRALQSYPGGSEAFVKKIDDFFSITSTSGKKNVNASGFVGQYVQGNEPGHHAAYLYSYAGQPRKTQAMVHLQQHGILSCKPHFRRVRNQFPGILQSEDTSRQWKDLQHRSAKKE